ncbi:hypothetical protein KR032_010866 [Drosophila birchii]|nr:hypothetical protein KR032_010866 [Drosophila birchii]
MIYSLRKKRQLCKIIRKWHAKRIAKKPCIFYMSCPELDAITGPPRRDPGVIVLHPIHALQLINMAIQRAREMGDRPSQRKLKRNREHVQTILNMLQVHFKMANLNIGEVAEENRMRGPDLHQI